MTGGSVQQGPTLHERHPDRTFLILWAAGPVFRASHRRSRDFFFTECGLRCSFRLGWFAGGGPAFVCACAGRCSACLEAAFGLASPDRGCPTLAYLWATGDADARLPSARTWTGLAVLLGHSALATGVIGWALVWRAWWRLSRQPWGDEISKSMDPFARLREIQRRALELQGAIIAMQSQPHPNGARGTDPTGFVVVAVGSDGLPSRIEVDAGWQRHLAVDEIAPSVLLAFQQAVADASRAWSESLNTDTIGTLTSLNRRGEAASEAPGRGSEAAMVQTQPIGDPRDPLRLTEDVLSALKVTRDQAAEASPTLTDWDRDRAVSITLATTGLQGCTISPPWAAREGSAGINAALSEALRQARAGIEECAAARKSTTQTLDELAQQALATLAGFQNSQLAEGALTCRPPTVNR